MWDQVVGAWNGDAAINFYKGSISKALRRARPGKRSHSLLEDNDRCFKCQKSEDAKEESGLKVFRIPARSPELNVCDYALWKAVTVRMRAQEKGWPKNKKESREQYVARLRKTAKSLPASFVRKSIGDMRRRCQRLHEAKGYHFEEGGGYRRA